MDILILDESFQSIDILDTYNSLIWVDRYHSYGDFEISIPIKKDSIQLLKEDYHLWIPNSKHQMIIENLQIINNNEEEGSQILVTGRSLESILDGRIIWDATTLSGNLQTEIHRLLNENIIDPSDSDRKIENFRFQSSNDPLITSLTVEDYFLGENLCKVISNLCKMNGIGFRIVLTDDNWLNFELYSGVDRSGNQTIISPVKLSPKFENFLNSNFLGIKQSFRTVALVEGHGVRSVAEPIRYTGRNRRELYLKQEHITNLNQLNQKGLMALIEKPYVQRFEGRTEPTKTFTYGPDFQIGDIIELENEYDMEARVRLIEVLRSIDIAGEDTYLMFDLPNESIPPPN